jgi:transcriptional regulator with XRE-family HTH domain|tara:strand:+ start:225 stop:416 length:192 start_codon:yes stop_codon:yes gene_type:complete
MSLKEILKEKGITVIFLSERLGLSRPTLYKYLDSPEEFKLKHFKKIAGYLDTTEREALINYFI